MGQAVKPLTIPPGVERVKFMTVVSAAYTAWISNRGQSTPSPDEVAVYANGLTRKTIGKIMDTTEFEVAVKERGMPFNKGDGLTSRQMLALSVMTDPTDKRNPAAKLRAVGVTYQEYRAWLNEPLFGNALKKIAGDAVTRHIPDMEVALTNKAINGDLNAIKFAFELTGKHDPAQKEVMQLRSLVQILLEIVTKNVTDKDTLLKIATEMQTAAPGLLQGEVIR